MDFSQMSDEELRQFLREEAPSPAEQAAQMKSARVGPPSSEPVDNTMGMSGPQLAAAGFAKSFLDPFYHGPKELAQTMFRKGQGDLDQLNKEKAERQEIDKKLMSNWPANMGYVGGKAAASLVVPARIAPQVGYAALDAAMSPTQQDVTGTGSLLGSRAYQGLEGGAAQAAVALPIKFLGKSIGIAANRLTPEGQAAMQLDEAARRLGVTRNLGSLDASSGVNAFERSLPGYSKTVEKQVGQFSDAARDTVNIPSKSGKSFEIRNLEGEKLRKAIVEGGENLKGIGNSMWNDLDTLVVQNNLPQVSTANSKAAVSDILQRYTPVNKKGPQLNKNPIWARINEYDPEAANALTRISSAGKTPAQIPFGEIHQVQTAVGRAMARAEKDAAAPGASMEDRMARNELRRLYGTLMTDVDSWGSKNPAAQELYTKAKSFWRDMVVPGAITNKVYTKASRGVYGANPRGYMEPSQLYQDVISNPRAIGDLSSYMTQPGRDMVTTLSTMPDMARSLASGSAHPVPSGVGLLTNTAGMALGSPLQLMKGIIGHLPGSKALSESTLGKRAYFARDTTRNTPLGKAAFALGKVPEQELEQSVRRVREGDQ